MEKKCTCCGEIKPLTSFYNKTSSRDGKFTRCKKCVDEKISKWEKLNPDKRNEYARKSRVKTFNTAIANLSDTYIIQVLRNKGFKPNQITTEIIELQRQILKTKRICKTSQN